VVHTPQFNGKQEEVNASLAGSPGWSARTLLTCAAPATVNGRVPVFQHHVEDCIPLSSLATERLEHALGKAMKVVPSARIPANKVSRRVDLSADGS
jgi:hypothetical protein